jgi:hypothetical protein
VVDFREQRRLEKVIFGKLSGDSARTTRERKRIKELVIYFLKEKEAPRPEACAPPSSLEILLISSFRVVALSSPRPCKTRIPASDELQLELSDGELLRLQRYHSGGSAAQISQTRHFKIINRVVFLFPNRRGSVIFF